MPSERIAATVEPERDRAIVRHAVAAQLEAAGESVVRGALGNARRHRIDHAPDGAAAVQERRRTAKDFDLVGDERFDADRVIVADRRGVHRVDAVFEHAHAGARKTADDRPRRAGAEIRRAHADLVRERFAEGASADSIQRLVTNDGHGLRDLARRSIVRHAGDDHFVRSGGCSLRVSERCERAAEGARNGERERRTRAPENELRIHGQLPSSVLSKSIGRRAVRSMRPERASRGRQTQERSGGPRAVWRTGAAERKGSPVAVATSTDAGSHGSIGTSATTALSRLAALTQILHGSPFACAARSSGCTTANVSMAKSAPRKPATSHDRSAVDLAIRRRRAVAVT